MTTGQWIKANLTWSAAAKFYLWLGGFAAALTAAQIDSLPAWVGPVIGFIALSAGWAKGQQPVPKPEPVGAPEMIAPH
jgi:hypothetical protein